MKDDKRVDWYAVLVILAVLFVMGVVGKMDADDALALEQATSTAPTSGQR